MNAEAAVPALAYRGAGRDGAGFAANQQASIALRQHAAAAEGAGSGCLQLIDQTSETVAAGRICTPANTE